jgi:hypothetical protein
MSIYAVELESRERYREFDCMSFRAGGCWETGLDGRRGLDGRPQHVRRTDYAGQMR